MPTRGDREAEIARLTQELALRTEAWVREHPEQWLWIHRRWKTQPEPGADDGPRADPRPRARTGSATSCCRCRALRDLRRNFPDARLEVLARPWVRRSLRRRARGRRGARRATAFAPTPRRCAAPSTPPCSSRTPSARRSSPGARADSRALGIRHRRPRAAAHARAARVPRRSGAAARCTTIGRCSRASGSSVARLARRVAPLPDGLGRARAASSWADGPWLGAQPGRLLRLREALAARTLRRGRRAPRARARGPASRSSGSAAERPLGEAIAAAMRDEAAASSAARRRLPSWWACLSRLRLLGDERLGPDAPGGGPGRAAGRGLRLDRLARDGAARRRGTGRPRATSTARPACCASARSTIAA